MTEINVKNCDINDDFKFCKKCKTGWKTRELFLNDPNVVLIGFMANNDDYEKGIYLFNHVLPDDSCNTTLGLFVKGFMDMYDGDIYTDLKMGTDKCSGHCAKVDLIEECNVPCRNAVARKIMHKIIMILPAHKDRRKAQA